MTETLTTNPTNAPQEEVPEETLPSEEYPRAYDQLDLIVRNYGTDWVRRAVDEISARRIAG